MKCAIMQPTYLPWSGYFNLITNVDYFIFLDDVQHERRSWQMRNRILLNGKECLLSVPIEKCGRETLLKDVRTKDDTGWKREHYLKLEQAYKKTSYGPLILDALSSFYNEQIDINNLSYFNRKVIVGISEYLGITTDFFLSSELNPFGIRSERLGNLCKLVGADSYLSPLGSREYLENDNFSDNFHIKLEYQSFYPLPYGQYKSKEFISHLSVVDLIANLGPREALKKIRG